jgi:hypothetical protein
MSFQAGAMAPVISDLPSPIIGNEAIASPPNAFVYPDAFNLDTFVTDDVTSDGAIIWSYENAGGRYSINGVDPLSGANPNSPGTSRLDTQDLDTGQAGQDSNAHTITLRDTTYSPVGGPNTAPPTTGIVANELVTLFASDGTTYSMKEMMIYTDNGGEDRLSSGFEVLQSIDWLQSAASTNWITSKFEDNGQTAAHTNVNGQGLCIQVGQSNTGAVVANWISPYQFIELTALKVYRIRTTVNAGNLPAGTTPLWGLTVDNLDNSGTVIDNKYGMEFFVLDNVGGANSVNGTTQKDFWFTPLPVLADDWNNPTTGIFQPSLDANNDARVIFRIVQASSTGYGGELDSGRVCLESIEVASVDINSLAVSSSDYSVSNLTSSTHFVTNLASTATPTFSGGNLTLTPPGGGWTVALIQVTPGNADPGYPNNAAEAEDNYPVVDTDGGVYRVQVGVQAPNAAAETLPPDAVRVGADDSTNEVLTTSNVLNSVNQIGMPKSGSVSLYTVFYDSGTLSLDTSPGAGRIRPRVDILCTDQIGAGGPENNPNGITFTSMSMEKVNTPN